MNWSRAVRRVRRSDTAVVLLSVAVCIAGLVALWAGFAWVIDRVSGNAEVRAFVATLTTWQWIAIVAVLIVWGKDFPKSELRDIAKALDRIADEMRKTRTGDKF